MKLEFNPYCRSCQSSHPPGQHKGGKPSPANAGSAAVPARAKSATKTKKARSSTPKRQATVTLTPASGATGGILAADRPESLNLGGRPSVQGKMRTLVGEVRKAATSKVDPLASLKIMSRIELEAIAAAFVMEKARRQKAKAKTQARWRKKVKAVENA